MVTAANELPPVLELRPGDGVTEATANEAPVVGFNLGGSLPPLVCFRAWRKEVDRYRSLASALGPEQPIYAASPPRGAAPSDFPRTTDEWARGFMDALGPILAREPLLLCGWSYAGVVALHVGELLAADGRPPRLVNLIDTTMPVAKPRGDRRKLGRFHGFVVQVNRGLEIQEREARAEFFRSYAKAEASRILRRYPRKLRRRLRRWTGRPPELPGRRPGGPPPDPLKRAIRVGYLKARPAPSRLPVALYWTEPSQAKLGDASLGWSLRMLGEFRCHPIDGSHETLFDPEHVGRLAASLGEELRRASIHSTRGTLV